MASERQQPGVGAPARSRAYEDALALPRLIAEGRLPPDIGVTCRGKTDGAGAQANAVISAMALARFADCRYLHSPFLRMDHADGSHQDWARRWEQFLNFGAGETPVPADAELVPLSAAAANPAAFAGRRIVIAEPLFALPNPIDIPLRDALRGTLRARYWQSPKAAIPSHRDPCGGFTVAIHLRRGDVTSTWHAGRYVPDAFMLRQVVRLRRALAPFGRPVTINLYSEGRREDFRAYEAAGCTLHIGTDPFESFHNMVIADVLLRGASSFSYVAALLSEGVVLSIRRPPPHHAGWLTACKNGDLSIKRLRRALLARLGWSDHCGFLVRRLWLRRIAGRA